MWIFTAFYVSIYFSIDSNLAIPKIAPDMHLQDLCFRSYKVLVCPFGVRSVISYSKFLRSADSFASYPAFSHTNSILFPFVFTVILLSLANVGQVLRNLSISNCLTTTGCFNASSICYLVRLVRLISLCPPAPARFTASWSFFPAKRSRYQICGFPKKSFSDTIIKIPPAKILAEM